MPLNNKNDNKHDLGTDVEKALKTLSDDFNISSSYLLWSHHAKVPAVLRFSFKRAYQNVGMSDKNHELTDLAALSLIIWKTNTKEQVNQNNGNCRKL